MCCGWSWVQVYNRLLVSSKDLSLSIVFVRVILETSVALGVGVYPAFEATRERVWCFCCSVTISICYVSHSTSLTVHNGCVLPIWA